MNVLTVNRDSYLLIYGLPALVILFATVTAFTPFIAIYPELAIGVTYDLTLTAPILYLFLIRKTDIPKITVAPIFFGCITLASYILSSENQTHLTIIKYSLLPIVELAVFSYVAFSAYKIIKKYRALKYENTDVYSVLRIVFKKMFEELISPQLIANRVLAQAGKKPLNLNWISNAGAFEAAFLYYGFFSWKRFKSTKNTFTYHKKNGLLLIFAVIIFLVFTETVVLHVLVAQWNNTVAWILTIPAIYLLLQIFAHVKAMFQRPIEVKDNKLYIRYGLCGDTEIELKNIDKIEFSTLRPDNLERVKQVALLGELEQINTIITLKNEETFYGIYGLKSKYKKLLVFIDEKENFKQLVLSNDTN